MPSINLIIRSPCGVFTLEDVSLAWSVMELKASIAMRMNRNRSTSGTAFGGGGGESADGAVSGGRVAVDSLRLISRGRVLNDDQTITSCGMTESQTIHVVVRGGGVTSPVNPTAPTSAQIGGQGSSAAAPVDNVMMTNTSQSQTTETEATITETSRTAEAESPESQSRENENNSEVTEPALGAEPSQAPPDGERAASLPSHTKEVAQESSSAHAAANADQTEAQSRNTRRPPQTMTFDANRIPPELAAGINIFLSGLTNSFGGSWATPSQGTNANATNAAPTPSPSPSVNTNNNTSTAPATSARSGNTTSTPSNTPSAGFDPSALLVGALPLMNSMLGNIRLSATTPTPAASSAQTNNGGSTTPTRQTNSSASTGGAQPIPTAVAGDATPTRAGETDTTQRQGGGGQGAVENVTAANPETSSVPLPTKTTRAPITNSAGTSSMNTNNVTTSTTSNTTCAEGALIRSSSSAGSCNMGSAAGILEAIANSVTTGILPILGVGVASTAAAVTNLTRAPSPASTASPSLLPFSPQQVQQSLLSGLASGLQNPATQTAILAAIPAGIAAINGLAGAARAATVVSSAATAYPAATMSSAATGGASALSLSGLGSFAGLAGLAGLGLASLTSLTASPQPTQNNNNNNNAYTNLCTSEPPREARSCRPVSSSNPEQQSTTVHHHYYYNNAGPQGNAHHQPPTATASAAGVRVRLSVSASELAEVPSALERYRRRLTEERSRAQHQQSSSSSSSQQGSSEAAGSNGSERHMDCDVVVNASLRDLDSLPSAVARLEAELGLRTSEHTSTATGIDVSEVAPSA